MPHQTQLILFFKPEKGKLFSLLVPSLSLFVMCHVWLVKAHAIFVCLHENYEFPEVFKHNKQWAIELSATLPSVCLLNHFMG